MNDGLKIVSKRFKEESVVVSARIPKDMLLEIDTIAKESGRNRNEIIGLLLDFALRKTEIIDKQ